MSMKKLAAALIALTALTGMAVADPADFTDSFESGDAGNFSAQQDGGGTALVGSTQAFDGSNSWEFTTDGDGDSTNLHYWSDAFSNSFSTNESGITTYIRKSNTDDRSTWGLQGSNFNGFAELRYTTSDEIVVAGDDQAETLVYGSPSTGTWYKLELILHDNGCFTARVRDTSDTLLGEQECIDLTTADTSQIENSKYFMDDVSGTQSVTYWDLSSYDVRDLSTNEPPVFQDTSTSPDPWRFLDEPNVTVNVTDPDGTVQSVEAEVFEDGQLIHQDVSFNQSASGNWTGTQFFQIDQTDVYYNVSLTATDDNGATSTTQVAQFINNTRPGVTIGQPLNQTYEGAEVDYAVTINDDGDDVENEEVNVSFYNDTELFRTVSVNEEDNTTFTGTLTVQTDGLHNFTVKGNETGIVLNDGGQNPTTVTEPVLNSTFYTTESTVAYLEGFGHSGFYERQRDSVQYFEDSFRVLVLALLVAVLVIGSVTPILKG